MIDILRARLRLGRQTIAYPDGAVRLPERFHGRPAVDGSRCRAGCTACADACPSDAVVDAGRPAMSVDLGRCLLCGACAAACPADGALRFTHDYRLAARTRDALRVRGDEALLVSALDARMRSLFGRSLRLRQVSAGGCNGCEAELNAAGNTQFDLSRFGIQFVASPRHADGLVVTGPVTENMALALRRTYEATPPPKLVVAIGACAISGGVFRGSATVNDGTDGAIPGVPVDLYVPGCPPHPVTVIDGLLRLLGRLEGRDLRVETTGLVGAPGTPAPGDEGDAGPAPARTVTP